MSIGWNRVGLEGSADFHLNLHLSLWEVLHPWLMVAQLMWICQKVHQTRTPDCLLCTLYIHWYLFYEKELENNVSRIYHDVYRDEVGPNVSRLQEHLNESITSLLCYLFVYMENNNVPTRSYSFDINIVAPVNSRQAKNRSELIMRTFIILRSLEAYIRNLNTQF